MKDYKALIETQLQKKLETAQNRENDKWYPWVDNYVLPFVMMTRALLQRHVGVECGCGITDCTAYCQSCAENYPCGTVRDIIGQLDLIKVIPVELDG